MRFLNGTFPPIAPAPSNLGFPCEKAFMKNAAQSGERRPTGPHRLRRSSGRLCRKGAARSDAWGNKVCTASLLQVRHGKWKCPTTFPRRQQLRPLIDQDGKTPGRRLAFAPKPPRYEDSNDPAPSRSPARPSGLGVRQAERPVQPLQDARLRQLQRPRPKQCASAPKRLKESGIHSPTRPQISPDQPQSRPKKPATSPPRKSPFPQKGSPIRRMGPTIAQRRRMNDGKWRCAG